MKKLKKPSLKNYLRSQRGGASIESALGTVVMIAASLLALDLYRLASTQTTTMQVAVSLADTVSRKEPVGLTEAQLRQRMTAFIQNMSDLLHEEQFPTSNTSVVAAAVYKNPGPPAALTTLWSQQVTLLGTATSSLTSCSPASQTNEINIHASPVTLPTNFTNAMQDREIVIVVEVCVERTRTAFPGATYAHYIVPSRDDGLASRLSAP